MTQLMIAPPIPDIGEFRVNLFDVLDNRVIIKDGYNWIKKVIRNIRNYAITSAYVLDDISSRRINFDPIKLEDSSVVIIDKDVLDGEEFDRICAELSDVIEAIHWIFSVFIISGPFSNEVADNKPEVSSADPRVTAPTITDYIIKSISCAVACLDTIMKLQNNHHDDNAVSKIEIITLMNCFKLIAHNVEDKSVKTDATIALESMMTSLYVKPILE